ncbi:MAG TPA: hypothetical protein VM345_18200 [Acidimicrobiales bacterium]|jgi:hypothetical protein|nr:hypothetical protein [Acidimicrobiales bacterium]
MPATAQPVPRAELAGEIARAAQERAAAPDFPAARIARIRNAAAKLGATTVEPGDIRHAALLLERQANVDLQVPTASRVPGVSLVKRVLKKLMIWYLRFLAAQVTAFGQATARFGVTVASRIDELEAEVADLRDRVARLEGK